MSDYFLHLYFAPSRWRSPTIIGSASDECTMYFEDSGYVHVEVSEGGVQAEIDPDADVHGHWLKSRRPMFTAHVEVPLPRHAKVEAHPVREARDGTRWLSVVCEPPLETQRDLWMVLTNAEADATPMWKIATAVQGCRAAATRRIDSDVQTILGEIGVKVSDEKWKWRFLEDITEGLTRITVYA